MCVGARERCCVSDTGEGAELSTSLLLMSCSNEFLHPQHNPTPALQERTKNKERRQKKGERRKIKGRNSQNRTVIQRK